MHLALFPGHLARYKYFEIYLKDGKLQDKVFAKTDKVIYLFDHSMWVNQNQLVIEDINVISDIIKQSSDGSELILFFHKIDLIDETIREEETKKINVTKEMVRKELKDIVSDEDLSRYIL